MNWKLGIVSTRGENWDALEMGLLTVVLVFSSPAFALCRGPDSARVNDAASSASSLIKDVTSPPLPDITRDIIYTAEITTVDSFFNETESTLVTEAEDTDDWTPCSTHPCKNGGLCVEDPLNLHLYSCECKDGYGGNLCGVKDDCAVSLSGGVCSKGACVYSEDAKSRTCKCFFERHWDEASKECREAEPPCFPNPCLNGGSCHVKSGGQFECACSSGYEGDTCKIKNGCGEGDACEGGHCVSNEEGDEKYCACGGTQYWNENYWNEDTKSCEDIVPPCIPNPCGNNGTCTASSEGDSFNCSCAGHFVDDLCEIPNICYSSDDETVCGENGICKVSQSSAKCICKKGFYLDEDSYTCREVKLPCFPNPCANNGLCVPFDENNFNCTCSEGFGGLLCRERDLCVLRGGRAFCGEALCKSDHSLETFYCECSKGHHFDFRSRTCSRMDFCPLMVCKDNEICINSTCTCQPNYKRNNETGNCEANFCAANPCPVEDMMCTEGAGIRDYYCSCPKGFAFNGTHCSVAACELPSLNECDQLCHPAENGSYTCACFEDFILNEDGLTCDMLISDKNATCVNKTCDKGACSVVDDMEICTCPPGQVEEDGECIDKCTANILPEGVCPGDRCKPFSNGFKCKCVGKFALSKDGLTCTSRRLCKEGELGWISCRMKNAICEEDWKSDLGYSCKCPFPQIMSSHGTCQDICSMEDFVRSCSFLGSKCDVDAEGRKMCRCPPLYRQPLDGDFCRERAHHSHLLTIPLDLNSYKQKAMTNARMKRALVPGALIDYFHIQTDIERSMATIFPELIYSNVLDCIEKNDYFLCKAELQFKRITEEGVKRLKSPNLCVSGGDSEDKCLIPPTLVVRKNQLKEELKIQEADPCEEDVKKLLCGSETVCVSSDSSFNCTCRPGYESRDMSFPFVDSTSYIEICNDVDECIDDMNACAQHTTCTNTMGSYSCSCLPGYRLRDKSSDPKTDDCLEICSPNPCVHGQCYVDGKHDFECKCDAGYTGALCDLRDENYENAQRNTIIVGAVLGGVLLITIILFVVTITRLKRKKAPENPDHMVYAAEMTDRRGAAVNNAYQRE